VQSTLANNVATETPTILIDSIQIGSHVVTDVRARVDPDGAMTLLGMSVLRQINGGKFTIYTANNVLAVNPEGRASACYAAVRLRRWLRFKRWLKLNSIRRSGENSSEATIRLTALWEGISHPQAMIKIAVTPAAPAAIAATLPVGSVMYEPSPSNFTDLARPAAFHRRATRGERAACARP
jgi:hypothetical protein